MLSKKVSMAPLSSSLLLELELELELDDELEDPLSPPQLDGLKLDSPQLQ